MAEPTRRKIKWATRNRRGKSRVWKSKWVVVKEGETKGGEKKPRG